MARPLGDAVRDAVRTVRRPVRGRPRSPTDRTRRRPRRAERRLRGPAGRLGSSTPRRSAATAAGSAHRRRPWSWSRSVGCSRRPVAAGRHDRGHPKVEPICLTFDVTADPAVTAPDAAARRSCRRRSPTIPLEATDDFSATGRKVDRDEGHGDRHVLELDPGGLEHDRRPEASSRRSRTANSSPETVILPRATDGAGSRRRSAEHRRRRT